MLQLLKIDRSHKYVRRKRFTCDARCDEILPSVIETMLYEGLTHICDFASTKCCSVMKFTLENASFASNQLDQFSHCHTRRKTVRVHNNVWANSQIRKGHVLLIHNQATYTLLTVTTTEFVTNFRSS